MQDWLGADSGLIASAELQSFVTPGTKVNLVKSTSVASTVCAALGTSETVSVKQVKIYPNPATNYINIEIPNFNKTAEIILFDVSGRRIYSESKLFLNGKANIYVGNLNNGNYILNINNDGQISSSKVIISK